MGEVPEPVDLVVLGGGPGGYTAALRAAELGRKVTVVDRDGLGGVCLNVGCIPSKLLIDTACSAELVGDMSPEGPRWVPDMVAWQARRSVTVESMASGVAARLRTAGVQHLEGEARFTGGRRIAVRGTDGVTSFLEFDHAILATGSRPSTLSALPIDGDRVLDSTGLLALNDVPSSLVVIGAGYIGIELAMAFAKLGSAVTIVEAGGRLLPGVPEFLIGPVQKKLLALGVDLLFETLAVGLTDAGVNCESSGSSVCLPADRVLVAVGRTPNTDALGLDAAHVSIGPNGALAVRADRTISGTSLAAIGDVTSGPMLAHKAISEGVVAAEALCGRKVGFEPAAVPMVVFSDPEIASAGHTRESAELAGMRVRASSTPMTSIRSLGAGGRPAGLVQLVVDLDADAVVGVHIVGPGASELIAEGVLAIELGAAPGDLAATIHPHPTRSEALQQAARLATQPATTSSTRSSELLPDRP